MSQDEGRKFQFSLKKLFVVSPIWLGVFLWVSSLFLPAGTKGDDTCIGIQLLIGSFLAALARPSLLGGSVVLLSTIAAVMHLLMWAGLAIWFTARGRYVLVIRGIACVLVVGAAIFKLTESVMLDATDVGFQAWISSFILVGTGLFVDSFMTVSKKSAPPDVVH
jgi:hypothetical protein